VADLDGTLQRFTAAGVLASPMSGQVRLMTHADLADADITAALDRIGPVEGTATRENGFRLGRDRAPARPAGR
jgi:threonine aldolase